mmetsp:Transcript_14887/g.42211  ORF Transcript_14887/g.42211 Transcript_14887/m.42211 type:complete len:80 (+) Transcript_14887:1101-1340(+)
MSSSLQENGEDCFRNNRTRLSTKDSNEGEFTELRLSLLAWPKNSKEARTIAARTIKLCNREQRDHGPTGVQTEKQKKNN